jgi:hemerythrin
MSEQTTQKEKVMGKINEIKKNVETFIADVNVNELKESLNTMVKDAQKDFSNLVDKDLGALKTKFAKEKSILEKKAKKFYEGHKKEIDALQAKFEKMVKNSGKKPAPKVAKAAPKKAPAKKVAPKKVVKVVQKISKTSKKK